MIKSNNRHLMGFASMITCLMIASLACCFFGRPFVGTDGPDETEVINGTDETQQADLASEAADEPDTLDEQGTEPVLQTPGFNEERPVGSYDLLFRVGSMIHKIDLFNFEHEISDIDEFNVVAGWLPDRSYSVYWSQGDYPTIGRPLVIETFPEGEVLVFDEMPEDINTFIWGPEPSQITFTTFSEDAYDASWRGEEVEITSIQILDLETGRLETLLTDRDNLVYYALDWLLDGELLLYQTALAFAGYSPLSHVFDWESQESIQLPCRHCRLSPDGQRFAGTDHYTYYRIDLPLEIVDYPSLEERVVYEREGYTAADPIWSPMGDWIAFSIYNYDEELLYDHIFLKRVIPMVIDPDGDTVIEVPVTDGTPILWHPDGSQLLLGVYHQAEDGSYGGCSLYLYDLNDDEAVLIFEIEHGCGSGFRFVEYQP